MSKLKQRPLTDGISLANLKSSSWFMVFFYGVIALVLIWQAWLPYIAERHYRDAYNFEVFQRPKYALEEYEAAIEAAPWETQYQMDYAKALSEFGMQQADVSQKMSYLTKAESITLHIVDMDPKNPWYKNRLATIYLMLAEADPDKAGVYTQKAENYIRESAERDKNNPLFILNLAYFLHRTKRLDEATVLYNKTLTMDNRLVEANFNLADIYRSKGDLDNTLKQYLQAYKMKPDFPNLNTAISSVYLELFNRSKDPQFLAKTTPYLEADLKKNSANLEVLKNLGSIYFQLQDWKNAARIYGQLLLFYPNLSEFKGFYQTAISRAK
jgi:tetratricopeptide (TPR) repeat protein